MFESLLSISLNMNVWPNTHTQTESFQSTQRQQNFKYTMHDANDASQCANYVRRSHSFVPKVQLEAMAELARLRHRYLQVQMTRRHTTITAILHLAILHSLSQVWGGKICVKLDVLQTCFKFYNVALVQQLQSEHFSQTRSPRTKKTFPTIWRNAAWWLRCISRVFSDFIWNTFVPDFASNPNILINFTYQPLAALSLNLP